jgi:rubrerythrin
MWRCRRCFKLTTSFAVPYGWCLHCGGELQMFSDGNSAETERLDIIRAAVQLELDAFHFYKLARDQARHWDQRSVMERLYEAQVRTLQDLEKRYHAHLDRRAMELSLDAQDRLAHRLFRGICLSDHSGVGELYGAALEMERRKRDQLRRLAAKLPGGPEKEALSDLATQDDEHVTLLECELGLLSQPALEMAGQHS